MTNRENVIKGLADISKYALAKADIAGIGKGKEVFDSYYRAVEDAIAMLKEQEAIVRCKDCKYWVPGVITDRDDFIPPKCGKYSQMVGHSADDFCSLAEQEVTGDE